MIAVDTSALLAVIQDEALALACEDVLVANTLIISAATLTEALIVSAGRNLRPEMETLIGALDLEIVEVTEAFARRAGSAYERWGKGFHPARLNYGDSFSYALAEIYDCPLLFVGDDFSQTDIQSALA